MSASSGAGQAVKACNQLICAMNLQAICEALALGRAAGLDLDKLREVLLGGAASSWMLQNLGPRHCQLGGLQGARDRAAVRR